MVVFSRTDVSDKIMKKVVQHVIEKLKTERILLREIDNSDIENVYRGLSNPEVIKHYGVSYSSLKETEAQMKWFADSLSLIHI